MQHHDDDQREDARTYELKGGEKMLTQREMIITIIAAVLLFYIICLVLFKVLAEHIIYHDTYVSKEEMDSSKAWVDAYMFVQPFFLFWLLARSLYYRNKFVREAVKDAENKYVSNKLTRRRELEDEQGLPRWYQGMSAAMIMMEKTLEEQKIKQENEQTAN